MKSYAQYDASSLSRFNPGSGAPLWWGIIGLILIEASVVFSFIVTYFYLSAYAETWPPANAGPPPLTWSTINLVLLLVSCGTMYWASWGINRSNKRVLFVGVSISVLMACIVLVLRSWEISQLDIRWDSNAYGSILWTIIGFHFVHVASAIAGSAVIAWLAWKRYFTRERQLGVVVDTVYWFFVALAWIPLYLTVYGFPRLL